MNKYEIRNTTIDDLDIVLGIYKNAREYMKENNNPDQWKDYWPSEEIIREDIKNKISFVVTDSTNTIYAVFAVIYGHDKTYDYIYEGKWISDETYNTVHRFASSMKQPGMTTIVMDYVSSLGNNIRADTHEANIPMQKALLSYGFKYCGKINPIEGGERLAYEYIKR